MGALATGGAAAGRPGEAAGLGRPGAEGGVPAGPAPPGTAGPPGGRFIAAIVAASIPEVGSVWIISSPFQVIIFIMKSGKNSIYRTKLNCVLKRTWKVQRFKIPLWNYNSITIIQQHLIIYAYQLTIADL